MRVKLNTGAFGMDFSATGTNRFLFAVDGEQNSADLTINVNGSAAGGGLVSGHYICCVNSGCFATAAGSADISIMSTNVADGATAIVTADLSALQLLMMLIQLS